MKMHGQKRAGKLFVAAISLALNATAHAGEVTSIKYTSGGSQIIITDLGLLPGGIRVERPGDQQRADHRRSGDRQRLRAAAAILGRKHRSHRGHGGEHESREHGDPGAHQLTAGEMAGTEIYGDNVYQGVYWNSGGEAFALPPMAGVDPFYGVSSHQGPRHQQSGPDRGDGQGGRAEFLHARRPLARQRTRRPSISASWAKALP